jgi:hypothetical protein
LLPYFPTSLRIGLRDSPAGLLLWMVYKLFICSNPFPKKTHGYVCSHVEIITWTLLHCYFAPNGQIRPLVMYVEDVKADNGERPFISVTTGVRTLTAEAEIVLRSWADIKTKRVWCRDRSLGWHCAIYERPYEMAVTTYY